jgi:hypothetical protein
MWLATNRMKFAPVWRPTGCKFGRHLGKIWLPAGRLLVSF